MAKTRDDAFDEYDEFDGEFLGQDLTKNIEDMLKKSLGPNMYREAGQGATSGLVKSLAKYANAMSKASQRVVGLQERLRSSKSAGETMILKSQLAKAQLELRDTFKKTTAFYGRGGTQEREAFQRNVLAKMAAIREEKKASPKHKQEYDAMLKDLSSAFETSTKKITKESAASIVESMKKFEKSLEASSSTTLLAKLDKIAAHQEELDEAQEEARKYLQDVHSKIRSGIANFGMGVADRVGLGKLNLGNAIRMVSGAYRGGKSTIHAMSKAYSGVRAYLEARAVANAGKGVPINPDDAPEGVGDEAKDKKLRDKLLQDLDQQPTRFRRLLEALRHKGQGGESEGGLLKNLLSKITSMFGEGGMLKSLGELAAKFGELAPIMSGVLRGLGAAGLVAGAGAVGWEIGSWINKNYGDKIGEYISYIFNRKIDSQGNVLEHSGLYYDATDFAKKAKQNIMTTGSVLAGAASDVWDAGKPIRDTAASAINAVSPTTLPTLAAVGGAIKSSIGDTIDYVRDYFNLRPEVDMRGLQPGMLAKVKGLAADYYKATGKKLNINSAFRSLRKQGELYAKDPKKAAPPGRSLHGLGLAIDTDSAQANELDRLGLLKKYGLERPVKNEKWHIQPKGIGTGAARAGLYSADIPTDQNTRAASQAGPGLVDQIAPAVASTATSTAGGTASKGAVNPTPPVSVNSIPTFDMSDGLLLSMNLGVLS